MIQRSTASRINRPREWMRRPCMILMQPASAQPSGSWAGCQQQLIAQRDPAALARGWPALARRSGRLAGSIPPGEGCQPPLGAAYCRGTALLCWQSSSSILPPIFRFSHALALIVSFWGPDFVWAIVLYCGYKLRKLLNSLHSL